MQMKAHVFFRARFKERNKDMSYWHKQRPKVNELLVRDWVLVLTLNYIAFCLQQLGEGRA